MVKSPINRAQFRAVCVKKSFQSKPKTLAVANGERSDFSLLIGRLKLLCFLRASAVKSPHFYWEQVSYRRSSGGGFDLFMPHLSFTQDLGTLLVGAVVWAFVFDRSGLVLSAFSSVLLSIACWIGCTAYAHLWNRRFHFTFKHHLLCFVAAVATFWSAFAFGIL